MTRIEKVLVYGCLLLSLAMVILVIAGGNV